MTWATLGRRARAFRAVHAAWSVAGLASVAWIWVSAARRRRDPWTWASFAFLGIEGGALVVGRGNCPMGPIQESWGDPVPFFELVLPPRAAKAAIPVLTGVAGAGMIAVLLRPPRTGGRTAPPPESGSGSGSGGSMRRRHRRGEVACARTPNLPAS